jgi:D-alanyl-D-alanine carboxypeptidase
VVRNIDSQDNISDIGGDVTFARVIIPTPVLNTSSSPYDASGLSACCTMVKDIQSGTVLFSQNEYMSRPLASITKLMSALVLLEHDVEWTTSTVVVDDAVVDTHMYAGDTYTLEQLWNAAYVGSSNKAVLTLVDATGWTREQFVARMNEKAQEIGLTQTVFVEPTGLDSGNVSNASDVALLVHEALQKSEIASALHVKEYTLYSHERDNEHQMWNTDWLLLGWVTHNFADFRGGKTGFIPSSGYNFTMEVADENGHAVDVVVLGSQSNESRFNEARDLAQWAFDNYTWN